MALPPPGLIAVTYPALVPDDGVPDDAVPWNPAAAEGLLPAWYMPAPAAGGRFRGWRRGVLIALVLLFVIIEAFGLCTTYGPGFR